MHLLQAVLAGVVVATAAACGSSAAPAASSTAPSAGATAPATATPRASAGGSASPVRSVEPVLTPVPGTSDEPSPPLGAGGTTTVPQWGTILDRVPQGFPVFAGASPADAEGPSSGAWYAEGAPVDTVAAWYRDRLEAAGFTTKDLSSPLEDGTRVLDTVSDVPECRIQTTFRPLDGSTMIVVLYGAGCAGGGG